jgi:alkanesulfonate monooxygenase SsuD/methylene tetrahydromethanopterin reductase-like flavin-dependent oxidoreductase (luciferase family)
VRFGLVLPIARADGDVTGLLRELVAETLAAERAGFDAVLLPEFHQARRHGAVVSPLLVLAHLAAHARGIRVGTAVLAGPLHHPVRLAEDAIMLDHLTGGGRVVLGLGRGHQEVDFAAFGASHARRGEALDETLDVLELAFSGQPFRHEGRHVRATSVGVTPRPLTRPRPEIWIGAHSPSGLERAARRGDRWIADPQRDVATIARLAHTYRERCAAHRTTPRIALFREAWIADDRAAAARDWAPHVLAVHRLYWHVGAYRPRLEPWSAGLPREGFTVERVAPGRFLMGSGADLREEIAEWAALTGADYLALRFRHPGGPPHEAALEALARFGDEVIARSG